jgi:hypothetical protein
VFARWDEREDEEDLEQRFDEAGGGLAGAIAVLLADK